MTADPSILDALPPEADKSTGPRQADDVGTLSLTAVEWTEDTLARVFTRTYGDRLLFDHTAGSWYLWRGIRWEREQTHLAYDLIRRIATQTRDKRLLRASVLSGAERMAQADRVHARTNDIWDRDPFLLCTPAGTVNLMTGELRESLQSEHITKSTSVAPAPPGTLAPRWRAFLAESTGNDSELIAFLQQIAGYALTGDIREHALFFVYGPGGNGKSVFLNTFRHPDLGDSNMTQVHEMRGEHTSVRVA